jgi:hypothetical protein
LYDENGNLIVDFVGRVETFESDFSQILNRFNLKTKIKPFNITRQKKDINQELYLTEENKEKIYNFFKIDFDTFGYEK